MVSYASAAPPDSVVCSNIHPIIYNKTQGRVQQHQQRRQQLQERVCLKIRAQLTPLQEPHHNDFSRQADSPGSIPSKSASYHICKPQPASKGHSLFRIAVPLLLPTSSRSTEAEHSNTPQPMLLTLHIEQHSGTRAYLWTGAKFVLPGRCHVPQANQSLQSVFTLTDEPVAAKSRCAQGR